MFFCLFLFCFLKAGWKESHATFMTELRNLQATGLTTIGQSLRTAFDLLNLNRLVTGIDNYGQVCSTEEAEKKKKNQVYKVSFQVAICPHKSTSSAPLPLSPVLQASTTDILWPHKHSVMCSWHKHNSNKLKRQGQVYLLFCLSDLYRFLPLIWWLLRHTATMLWVMGSSLVQILLVGQKLEFSTTSKSLNP